MTQVVFLGKIEGASVLLDGDFARGVVWYSLRVYWGTMRGRMVGIGTISGEEAVLQQATAARLAKLRFENGETVCVSVQRKSIEDGYVCIGIDGPVPGFQTHTSLNSTDHWREATRSDRV